jgi:hypothetical protein
MGDHDKDKDQQPKPEDDGEWTKPVPEEPDPGKHAKDDE